MKKRVSYVFCNSYSKSCQETEPVFFLKKKGKEIVAKKEPEEQSSS